MGYHNSIIFITKIRLIFIAVLLIYFFNLKTFAQTSSGNNEINKEIERLRSQIQEIQKLHEKQIQELNRRIQELESRSKLEAQYERQRKLPEEAKDYPEKTFINEWWRNIEAGYSSGFLLRTNDDLFSLKINFRSQFPFVVENEDDETDTGFDIRRMWVSFRGNAFRPWLKYLLILEPTDEVTLLDYIVDLAKYTQTVPRLGQFRVPFNREDLTDPFNLQLVDTSILNQEFRLGRDIGASAGGVLGKFITYSVGVFNGDGRNSVSENSNLLYTGRVMLTPTGEPRYSSIHPFPVSGDYTYSQGAFGNPEVPLIAISAALAYLPGFKPDEKSPDNVFINDRVTALGSDESDILQFTADILIKYLIFSFETEYNLRNINPDEAGIDNALAQGIRIQSGVFLIPEIVEVAGRFVMIDLGIDSGGDRIWEITPGLSFYFTKSHSLKLQFDYSFIRDEFLDVDTNRVRAQFTVSF